MRSPVPRLTDRFTSRCWPRRWLSGIGLTIAKALTRAHRGVLTAESEGLGRGSKFTLRLPVAASKVVDT